MEKETEPETFLGRREQGSGANIILLLTLFVFFLMFLSIMQMGYQKVKFIKYQVDNGAMLSAIAATVADFYEYSTYERLLFDCTGMKTDEYGMLPAGAGNQYDSNIYNATKNAYDIAFQRFQEAAAVNIGQENEAGRGWQYEVKKFVVYNVYNDDVYVSENTSNCIFYSDQKGTMKTPDEVTIYNSGVYVKLELKVHFMTIMGHSYDYTIPVEEFIDMDNASELM